MCGICGFIGAGSKDILIEMTDTLRHRGPDESGYFWQEGVGIGHRRLKIIDLVTGQQPMFTEDKNLVLSYNGEIYNFKKLKTGLENKGYKFSTTCDTEVLLYAYREWGAECLKLLNGMYAFGIYDFKENNLFLARDRFGQKPLYYYHKNGLFIFASELKSIIKHPEVTRTLNIPAFRKYLWFEYVPEPDTIFKNIYKLPGGYYLNYIDGTIEIKKYWDCRFNGADRLSVEEVKETLLTKLKESVNYRLMSDVPLGVFLSGGIDSSAITALLTEILPAQQIKTFSIGFAEKTFDESRYYNRVAEYFGTDHHQQILHPEKMIDIIPEIFNRLDEPFADDSVIPTYLLSKFTRENVTVALSGDGGDELFAGYDPFIVHYFLRNLRLPGYIKNCIEKVIEKFIPVSDCYMSLDFRIKRMVSGLNYPPTLRNQVWLGAFPPADQTKLLNKDLLPETEEDEFKIITDIDNQLSGDLIQRLIYNYVKLYLQGEMLVKVDRASMMHSLEVRSPFLDHNFAGYINSLPSNLKIRLGATKYILKQSLKEKIPSEIINRKKKGFGTPLTSWFKNELKDLMYDSLLSTDLKNDGLFNMKYVKNIIDQHLQNQKDNRKELWTLLAFQLWKKNYYTGN